MIAFLFLVVILFIWEPIRIDLIALSIPLTLFLLKPWTGITANEALSGFSNQATITILAMFILSRGIYQSGVIQILGDKILNITGKSEKKQLAVTTSLSGVLSGIVNNTPLVAILIPMITELARKTKTSPSRLLIPISFASMLGGMLTLFGTSTNIIASEISGQLLNRTFSIFEFSHMALILLILGIIYLVFFSKHFIPERINPNLQLTERYEMGDFLTKVIVRDDSPLIGSDAKGCIKCSDLDMNLVQLLKDDNKYIDSYRNSEIQAGDCLILRTDQKSLLKFIKNKGIDILPNINVSKNYLERNTTDQKLIELVIPHGSKYEGQNLKDMDFIKKYRSTLLAIRHSGKIAHMDMENMTLKAGDIILLLIDKDTMKRLQNNRNFLIISEIDNTEYRKSKIPTAIGIIFSVILLSAFNILPIVMAAIAGILAMVITGCIKPSEIYEAVNWEVIFMLAGLIPLGIAINKTGTNSFFAEIVVRLSNNFNPIFTLALFYIITVLLTNIISNNASVILMIPIAVDTALHLGANPFSFVLIVTFAASSAFLTPIGYQTNLMVYGPGGYQFKDFLIAGAPLQIIMSIITPVLIVLFWGI